MRKRHVQVWLKWFRILPRSTLGNTSDRASFGSWSPEDSVKTDVRKEGPHHPSDGIQTRKSELTNHDPWSCFSTFLQPHFMTLMKVPGLILQSTSALNSKRRNSNTVLFCFFPTFWSWITYIQCKHIYFPSNRTLSLEHLFFTVRLYYYSSYLVYPNKLCKLTERYQGNMALYFSSKMPSIFKYCFWFQIFRNFAVSFTKCRLICCFWKVPQSLSLKSSISSQSRCG